MYEHILIALEGKPTDEAAIAHVAALARQISAKITILRVITVAADGPGALGKQFQTELGSSGWRRKNQAEEALAKLEKRMQMVGLFVETALVLGDRSEADEIVSFATEGKYDLIVMAADGRPWWQRSLFGCPAEGVQRKAAVPTLFVSDGTRRARVATQEKPPINPLMSALGSSSI
jgi:nucleotide-binding universal stress UspA family protein